MPVPRETSVVAFPSSNPVPTFDDLPAVEMADDPGESGPSFPPPEKSAPQGTHCPAGYCPLCWEKGDAVALLENGDRLGCPGCLWSWPTSAPAPQATPQEAPPPSAFQTLLLPHRAPGVDPMLHVAFWAGRPHEVLAIASPETVSCGSLALPPGARVFFLRELP